MNERLAWHDLPRNVRAAVEHRTGPVTDARTPRLGFTSDFSATLELADGPSQFVKAIRAERPDAWMHRNEITIGVCLPPGLGPRLLWHEQTGGWLLLGFEHIPGEHPSLAPGSADLDAVTDALGRLSRTPAEPVLQPLEKRWSRQRIWERYIEEPPADLDPWCRVHLHELAALDAESAAHLAGTAVVHGDIHPGNMLLRGTDVLLVDWAWARAGAPWVDAALLVLRLVAEGHRPQEAETATARIPAWTHADDNALAAFAATITGAWEHRTRTAPRPHSVRLTEAARTWLRHRIG